MHDIFIKIISCLIISKRKRNKFKRKYENPIASIYSKNPKGTVLVSYLKEAALCKDDHDSRLNGHSNMKECRDIIKIFLHLGYNVDVINWDQKLKRYIDYDVIFDIHQNLGLLAPFYPNAVKFLHITGSYPKYQNTAAQKRIADFNRRHHTNYHCMRITDENTFEKSINFSDYCTLIGNEHTRSTFPKKYQSKIYCVPVTASQLKFIKKSNYVPPEKEFLFFSGCGAVHKGLDLAIEVFLQHPEWKLNIVGAFNEENFWNIYSIKQYQNIRYYGFLDPSSQDFTDIVKRCFTYIFLSCSEGASSAAITAMSIGLYPILSKDTGVDLPKGCGIILKNTNISTIENAIYKVLSLSDSNIENQIKQIQTKILKRHSQKYFLEEMKFHIEKALKRAHHKDRL